MGKKNKLLILLCFSALKHYKHGRYRVYHQPKKNSIDIGVCKFRLLVLESASDDFEGGVFP